MRRNLIRVLCMALAFGSLFFRVSFASERHHWNLGDVAVRKLGGNEYSFRCIDQDYSDEMGNYRGGALFLCDEVIPADLGSQYVYEMREDGSHDYVFRPGEIVNFGLSNEYKYSKIRRWLKQWEEVVSDAEPIAVGTSYAYCGTTEKEGYADLNPRNLHGSYIGFQHMTDRLFCLSVEEALRYREWLWRFSGAESENPETQYGTYCKGYWLRSPVGTEVDYDTDLVYIVDLVNGMIRTEQIMPDGDQETLDEELRVTTSVGVRPAFVLPQDKSRGG